MSARAAWLSRGEASSNQLVRVFLLMALPVALLMALLAALLVSGCASPLPAVRRAPEHAIADVGNTTLGRLAVQGAPAQAEGAAPLSGFRLLPDASFAFDARVSLVRSAEKSLDVQYYLIQGDDVGLLLLRELRDAAARGVRVRLLVDDFYTAGEDELFSSLNAFPNVEVRLFNPLPARFGPLEMRLLFSLGELKRINHRMHNKLLIADSSFAVSGGRNIGNEYFMRSTAANFIDMDVISNGPIVREMSSVFDMYWNSEQVWPFSSVVPPTLPREAAQRRFDEIARTAKPDVQVQSRDVLNKSPVGEQLATERLERYWARARLFADDPAKITREPDDAFRGSVTEGALGVFGSARRSIRIGSPYFIPGPIGMALMRRQLSNGISYIVTTNSLGATDEPLAYADYERYRADMLKIGVVIHEISPTSKAGRSRFGEFGKSVSRLHGKLAVIDDERMFVGSMNLDYRSAAVNTELGLLIESPELVAEYNRFIRSANVDLGYRLRLSKDGRRTQWLEYDDQGADVVHEEVPGTFIWLRFKNWLLLPLVGEEHL